MISAIYVSEVAREGEHAADGQLSLFYGHLAIHYLAAYAMDESWERLELIFGLTDS